MRKFIVGAAAAAMVAGGSMAQAAPVGIEDARAGSAVSEADDLRGKNGTHLVLGLLAAIIVGFVVWQVMQGPDDNSGLLPRSP